jgi:hypothetical protein
VQRVEPANVEAPVSAADNNKRKPPIADEMLTQFIRFLGETGTLVKHVSSSEQDLVHRIFQALSRLCNTDARTLVKRANHLSQFREPSNFFNHCNIPYYSHLMNGKKRKKKQDHKRKRGDAATGKGSCTNRGRRGARVEAEEEPEDLAVDYPDQTSAPSALSAPSSAPPSSRSASSSSIAVAAPVVAPASAPSSARASQATTPIVEL